MKDQVAMAKKQKDEKDDFLLVGLGASAGGVQALQTFFTHLPAEDNNMAFVVIVHLSEKYDSQMHNIIQARTKMPVIQVKKPVKVQPAHVYVIPPAKQLQLVDGIITLSPLERTDHINLAINHFFRTLAQVYGDRAVGIILSGTGSDGTIGLKMIKENNGITMVQDPDEAEFPEMPTSAIETEMVDVVLPVRDMPGKLIQLRDSNDRLQMPSRRDHKDVEKMETLQEIIRQLRIRSGADFSHYKVQTLFRRTIRQMQIRGKENLEDYLLLIQEDPDETESLLKSLLINVTEFFRDQEAFAFLEGEVIPNLFQNKTSQDRVRIWVPACASGEEAYSIAILVAEYLSKIADRPEVQIFASDLSKEMVTRARGGQFSKGIAINLSEERLKRFFTEEENSYRISKEIREMVLFTPHNILGDPPFLHMDLISCRNFLIYLSRAAQKKVLRLFHFALLPGRYLFLGSSESVENETTHFSPLKKEFAVYERLEKLPGEHAPLTLPASPSWQVRTPELKLPPAEKPVPAGELHFQLLEYYAAPSVLVNEDYEIVHFSENAGRYFRFPGGDSSLHLMNVLLPSLRPDLRALLFTVRQQESVGEAKNLKIEEEDPEKRIDLKVYPIQHIATLKGYFLILFQERSQEEEVLPVETEEFKGKAILQEMLRKLEDELKENKGRLRRTIEQFEALVEELKASNEELFAVNEEMRSTTEELETGKEELQSVNEELKAVNVELKGKVEDLSRSNADLQNLMKATNIGTIFLDRDLKIQLFTPPIQSIFNLIATDIDRPITHITSELDYPELSADIQGVWQSLQAKERELRSKTGHWYFVRIIPYRSLKDQVEGVVLTFVDFTERKMAEEAMTEDRLRLSAEAANIGLWEYYPEEHRVKWSDSLCKLFGIQPYQFQETLDHWYRFIHPEGREKFQQKFEEGLREEEDFSLEFRGQKQSGETCWFFCKARTTKHEVGKCLLVRGAVFDITDRKLAEEVLQESSRRKGEFLAILSHELRNPLTPISAALELMHPGQEPEQAQQLQAIIVRQVKHIEYLIRELLDISRVESGKIELHEERVLLQDVISQALEVNQHGVETNHHNLKTGIPQDPIYLDGDKERLVQIVHNLLSNAVKYTEPGGKIELEVLKENKQAVIRVKDNGIGIASHQQAEIFDMFFQVEQKKKQFKPGLGIGLNLVKQLVALHGGSVEVKSGGLGTGSEFIVRLPLAAKQTAGLEEGNPGSKQAPIGKPVKLRILVVDDNEDIAFVTAEALKLKGHEITIVHNGEDAIHIAQEIRPDVAVIDIGLEDISGYEVAGKIRSSLPDILLVAYSGLGQEEDRRQAQESGFDSHVTKPAKVDELADL